MSEVIIYKTEVGGVAVVHPTPEALAVYGALAIAQKDVPAGRLFKIIDIAELPQDRTQRAAWTVDEADLTDGIGAEFDVFEEAE
jgi:hypothetical protein